MIHASQPWPHLHPNLAAGGALLAYTGSPRLMHTSIVCLICISIACGTGRNRAAIGRHGSCQLGDVSLHALSPLISFCAAAG